MANKNLLGLNRYLMRKVSVCTSKLSRFGSVYKLTVQRSQGSNLRFQPILWKHDNHTILYDYAQQKQNYCSLDLTSLFHHMLGFMLLAYTGKCPQADPAKRTTDKTSSAVTTQFVLKLWLLIIKTWYFQNWDRYMCGFLITSTTSNCAIVKKIGFQTRQFGHQWSCQNTCWLQLGHVSSAGDHWADWIQTPGSMQTHCLEINVELPHANFTKKNWIITSANAAAEAWYNIYYHFLWCSFTTEFYHLCDLNYPYFVISTIMIDY